MCLEFWWLFTQYDDLHPYEAMELIKRLCDKDPVSQRKAFLAAKEGLAYYELALDECYKLQNNN